MKIDDVTGGRIKIGNTTYEMVEAKYNGTVVWPLVQPVVITYEIEDSWFVYSNGGDILLASGGNYATAWGTIAEYHDGVYHHTLDGSYRLTVRLPSNSPFYVSDNEIHGNYLADTDNTGSNESRVFLRYEDGFSVEGPHIFQQINSAGEPTISYGEIVWDDSSAETRHTNYTFSFSARNFYDIAHKCAATGGSTTLALSASHHTEVWKDYTQTNTLTYTYTSGYIKNTQQTVSGNDKYSDDFVNDVTAGNTTITTQVYSPGFNRNNLAVTVDNMGTTPWPTVYTPSTTYGRSITYRAILTKQDGSVISEDVTLYQAVNKEESRTPTTGEWQHNTPVTTTEYSGYYAVIVSSKYGPDSPACSAAGNGTNGEDILTLAAGHIETPKTTTYYYQLGWDVITWTTGQTSQTTPEVVNEYDDVTYGTAESVSDTYTVSVSGAPFTVSGTNVKIPSEGTTRYPNGRSATLTIVNDEDSSVTNSVVLSQALNDYTTSVETRGPYYGEPYKTVDEEEPNSRTVSIILSGGTQQNPAPASESYVGCGISASHYHIIEYSKDWHTEKRNREDWSSGATSYSSWTLDQSGTDPVPEMSSRDLVTDTPTVSIPSSAQSWLSYDAENSRLVFASRGTITGSARNATVTATNGDATDSVTVYQEANSRSMSFIYNIVLELQHQGNLPGDAGRYAVAYTSERTLRYTYTSGEHTDETNPYTTNVVSSAAYCEPSVSSVSGTGVFYIDVEQNPSSSQTRSFTLRLSGQSSSSQPLSITQEAYVPAVQDVATLEPIMFSVDTGPYLRGKVYYLFTIDSGTVTSSTITGVNFCYRVNGGTKQTVQIGSFAVAETSQPTALEPSGVTIPTFSSGTVKAWFEVTGSTGDFDSINAGEEDHSITITF